MRTKNEIEEMVSLTISLQQKIGSGKDLGALTLSETDEIVSQLARLSILIQKSFSLDPTDSQLSLTMESVDGSFKGSIEFKWLSDGFPEVSNQSSLSQIPSYLILPLRAHVELRKRLHVHGFTYQPSAALEEYMCKNPGDGGIDFFEDSGPRNIYPDGMNYYKRFYPNLKA